MALNTAQKYLQETCVFNLRILLTVQKATAKSIREVNPS